MIFVISMKLELRFKDNCKEICLSFRKATPARKNIFKNWSPAARRVTTATTTTTTLHDDGTNWHFEARKPKRKFVLELFAFHFISHFLHLFCHILKVGTHERVGQTFKQYQCEYARTHFHAYYSLQWKRYQCLFLVLFYHLVVSIEMMPNKTKTNKAS